MTRSPLPTLALLIALSACESNLIEGTAPPHDAPHGRISFALDLAEGVELQEVRYRISRDGGFELDGTIALLDDDDVFKALITLPSASAYSLDLAGDTAQGATCTGHARFDIWPGAKTAVNVLMRCPGMAELGAADLNGLFNVCPFIDAVLVQPDQVEVGATFALTAGGHDQDDSGTLQYRWTATGGSLMHDTSADASLLCTAPGPISVRLTLSDGDLGCDVVSPVIEITCNPAAANDGMNALTGTGGSAAGATAADDGGALDAFGDADGSI